MRDKKIKLLENNKEERKLKNDNFSTMKFAIFGFIQQVQFDDDGFFFFCINMPKKDD
jgi:hypothetical protein